MASLSWTFFSLLVLISVGCTHAPLADSLLWHAIESTESSSPFRVHGLPWFTENRNFDRLPDRLKAFIQTENKDAWDESLCPSGARVRFQTDSRTLRIRVLHGNERVALPHQSSTSTAGMDLYETVKGQQVYRGTSRPASGMVPYQHVYFENANESMREFTLYLPTYARLKELEVGLDRNASVAPSKPYRIVKPIVFYGTSITQSCCASRGSNGFAPLLSRMLSADIVNLGFSGAGLGESWMAELLSEIDASAYVIDPVSNMGARVGDRSLMELNYERFVKILRSKKPKVPIILMTRIRYAEVRTPWGEQIRDTEESYQTLHRPLYATYEALKSKGDARIWVFDASRAIPLEPEHMTVDGIHPTDRGFEAIAMKLAPVLQRALNESRETP